jgi:hypothetical protein
LYLGRRVRQGKGVWQGKVAVDRAQLVVLRERCRAEHARLLDDFAQLVDPVEQVEHPLLAAVDARRVGRGVLVADEALGGQVELVAHVPHRDRRVAQVGHVRDQLVLDEQPVSVGHRAVVGRVERRACHHRDVVREALVEEVSVVLETIHDVDAHLRGVGGAQCLCRCGVGGEE